MKTIHLSFKFLTVLALSAMLFNSCSEDDVEPEPTAAYTFDEDELTVTFTNASENAESYTWDFGDGETSTREHPTHTYSEGGTYTVELTATGAGGSDAVTEEVTVVAPVPEPIAGYTYDAEDLTVSFTNVSENAVSYEWDFGDDNSSTEQDPSHTYAEAGTYTVVLTATGEDGTEIEDIQEVSVEAPVPGPTADFTYDAADLTISFINASENAVSYEWDFGDENTSTDENPIHTYAEAGTYTVVLTTTGEDGTEEKDTQEIIVEAPAPVAHYTYDVADLTVSFTNASENAVSYEWDFGDENTSTDENPTHTYAEAGTYTVVLTATGEDGTEEKDTQEISVEAPAPVADYTYEAAYLTVSFTNASENAISYEWNFGDGDTSAEENPTHTYAEAGTYTVVLTATGEDGTEEKDTQEVIVEAPVSGPAAEFTYQVADLTVSFTNASVNTVSYEWNFGDGETSTEENPTYTYAAAGTYTVVLTATGEDGTEIKDTQEVMVTGTGTEPNPVPVYFDVADQPEIRQVASVFRQPGNEQEFSDEELQDITWEGGIDLTYTAHPEDNAHYAAYNGDWLAMPAFRTGNYPWIEFTTPELIKGEYKVWITYRRPSKYGPVAQALFNGELLSNQIDFSVYGNHSEDPQVMEAQGYKQSLVDDTNNFNSRLMGTITVENTGRHTLRLEALADDGRHIWIDVIEFRPVGMDQLWPKFNGAGELVYEDGRVE